jgi:hypothetical protein
MSGPFRHKKHQGRPACEASIAVRAGRVELSTTAGVSWSVAVGEIAVLAEFTNEEGPWSEDYFWILLGYDGTFYYAPMGAAGILDVASEVKRLLSCDFSFDLFHSTTFASRILWPAALAGKPLFRFEQVPRSWCDKLLGFWKPGKTRGVLTDEVVAFLQSKKGRSAPTLT